MHAVGSGTETNAQTLTFAKLPFAFPKPPMKTRKHTGGRPTHFPFTSLISLCHNNPTHPAEAYLSPLDPSVTSAASKAELGPT